MPPFTGTRIGATWKPFVVLGLVAVGAVLLAWAWPLFMFLRPLPSDADLHKRFRNHRAEFDSLAAIALADTLLVAAGVPGTDVYVRTTSVEHRRLTTDEVANTGRFAYGRLLARAGVRSISRSRQGNVVDFWVGSNYEHRKGIRYSEAAMEPLMSSLDRAETYGYVALAPRWFLYLEPGD